MTAALVYGLEIDAPRVVAEITSGIRDVIRMLGRRGAVIGLSGGVDSTLAAALCVRALGKTRVLALLTPERESAPETLDLSRQAAEHLGVDSVVEDITAILEASGCYARRDRAIARLIPEYGDGWRSKLVLPSILHHGGYRVFRLVAESPEGQRVELRLPAEPYREIVAATSFKQRTRKMIEYYYADLNSYAVVGTPNRLEYDQGFFVKNGDGAADLKPIAHLYKTQVYKLAEYLELPPAIRSRPPTTDTYTLRQTQEEFYFSLPYETLDICVFAHDRGDTPHAVAADTGLTVEQVERIFHDIERKRAATRYLRLPPQLIRAVEEIGSPGP